jgi:4-amino-4-deoxy-L-arabinose transferase-like glycosyltransferase
MTWQGLRSDGIADARASGGSLATATWWHVPVLLGVALLLLVSWQDDRPLHGDAAMYGAIAKAVLQTGDATHLTINGRPYFNKPPLFFWLTALAYRALGFGGLAPLLVSGLLGVANVLLLHGLCRRMGFDPATAFAAALAYMTTPEVVHWTRGVHLESILTLWILLGLGAAYASIERPGAVLLLGLAAAGGWMAKGPQGLFGIAVAPLLWWRHGVLRERARSPWLLAAVAVVLVLVVPWTWARIEDDAGYADTYFRGQIGGALLEGTKIQRGPFWYLGKLGSSYWPWLPFAVAGIVVLARRVRDDAAAQAWLGYGAIVLAVTMAVATRRPRYLFPLYPLLAVASGVSLGMLARRWQRLLPALAGCALAVGLVTGLVDQERSSRESDRMRGDVIALARTLPADAEVWLASDVPLEGMPGIAKVLGLYAPPLLCSCGAPCTSADLSDDDIQILTLAQSAAALAAATGATIDASNDTVALLRVPETARDAALARACALAPVLPPW